jgi:hypothetical protein
MLFTTVETNYLYEQRQSCDKFASRYNDVGRRRTVVVTSMLYLDKHPTYTRSMLPKLRRRRPVLRRRKTGRSLWGSHTEEISHLTHDKQI